MHDGKLEDTEKPPLLYHWATQSQALSAICITAQVVLSASVAHLVARWNTCEETWPSKGVDWGGLKWALSISLPTIMSYKVYFVCCQTRNVMSVLSCMSFKFVLYNCAYTWLLVFGKQCYFMNVRPLQPLYPPCLDCAFLKTTTTPTIRDSKIISATPPSVLTKTIEITVVLNVGAEKGTELRVK